MWLFDFDNWNTCCRKFRVKLFASFDKLGCALENSGGTVAGSSDCFIYRTFWAIKRATLSLGIVIRERQFVSLSEQRWKHATVIFLETSFAEEHKGFCRQKQLFTLDKFNCMIEMGASVFWRSSNGSISIAYWFTYINYNVILLQIYEVLNFRSRTNDVLRGDMNVIPTMWSKKSVKNWAKTYGRHLRISSFQSSARFLCSFRD